MLTVYVEVSRPVTNCRELKPSEYELLKTFTYEAIFIPDGAEQPDRSIVELPELSVYYDSFGSGAADICIAAECEGNVVGAAWARIMDDYGHVENDTPSLAISVLREYRGRGIGTQILHQLLESLRCRGYEKVSFAVQKANYAVSMYKKSGFRTADENDEEFIMVCGLTGPVIYKELGILTKDKGRWQENITYVSSLLNHESVKIRAKALWLLGEMGLAYPMEVRDIAPAIAAFFNSPVPLLRERAVNAMGRIGRGRYNVIEPYWADMFRFASDEDAGVRLSFVWASENIATNNPDIYGNYMPVFEKLLYDKDDKVRMEAPEMFRVIGKRRPEFVIPYTEQLQRISETDINRVVRIHCLGAIKAAGPK